MNDIQMAVSTLGWWKSFLDSLATDGGAIAILLYLMVFGLVVAIKFDMMIGSNIISGSFGALLMKITHTGTNRDQLSGTRVDTRVTTVTPPVVGAQIEPTANPGANQ